MNAYDFQFSGSQMRALPSGALYWPDQHALCVSDLHLGKSDRIARRQGNLIPPYEIRATLDKLELDIAATAPKRVICLGDSFDDLQAAQSLDDISLLRLTQFQAGRDWIWIEGNHDPGPVSLGGTHLVELAQGPLVFRHIAEPDGMGEVSGHFHPKAGIPKTHGTRPCFVVGQHRLMMPAYGAYTGGLRCTDHAIQTLFPTPAIAILTGQRALPIPLPRKV